jgi:hypothetical protein
MKPGRLTILHILGVASLVLGMTALARSQNSASTGIPILHSHASAPRTLYLDFNGHVMPAPTWEEDGVTFVWHEVRVLPFSLDADRSTFSAQEREMIRLIWKHVAEDYAPFDINVTTVEPDVLAPPVDDSVANGMALRVVIGDWDPANTFTHEGEGRGGFTPIAYGGFTNFIPNDVFVFPSGTETDYDPFRIAHVASHEAAHAFGLGHLNLNQSEPALIMDGTSANAFRSIWGIASSQDDVAMLTAVLDARADDHGSDVTTPTPLALAGVAPQMTLDGTGIIEQLDDKDFFSFWAGSGQFTVRVDVPLDKVANLDAEVELWERQGGLWSEVQIPSGRRIHVASDLWAGFWHFVPQGSEGEYRVAVKSDGTYGDLGRYIITVTGQTLWPDTAGPRVEGSFANGPRNPHPYVVRSSTLYAVGQVTVAFDRPITGNIFQAIDLSGPAGPIGVTSVQVLDPADPRVFDVMFPSQSTPGLYQLTVHPIVESLHGNFLMNQDGDSSNGEPIEDVYTAVFSVRDPFFDYLDVKALGLERFQEPIYIPKWPIELGEPIIDTVYTQDRKLTFVTTWKSTAEPDLFVVTARLYEKGVLQAEGAFKAQILFGKDGDPRR